MTDSEPVIIKRGRRNKGHGKHGGAWKVAFADFTLAMMAFFMVLWILAITNDAERKKIAHYMRTNSIFDGGPSFFQQKNSPFPIDLGGTPSIVNNQDSSLMPPDNPRPGMSEFLQIPKGEKEPVAGNGEKLNSAIDSDFPASSELSLLLKNFEELSKEELLHNNILVEEVPSGLRIIIKDDDNHTMFAHSEKTMSPFFEDLFLHLGGIFKDINNKIIISGHSDASQFKGRDYTNWELSAARAQQARQIMTAGGMPNSRVMQVNSFSSNRLLNKIDKSASENRRVELLLLTTDAEKEMNKLFSDDNVDNPIKKSANAATANKPVMRLESNDE